MRILLTTIAILILGQWSQAQKAMTFDEAKAAHIRTSQLDSTYASGLHADTTLSVFNNNSDAYMLAYQNMLKELGQYLREHDFMWSGPTKGFNRIYFDKSGKIDYFLYSFRPGQLSPEQEKEFGELLSKFVLRYRFPLKAPVKFAQCSPVTYMPAGK